jgi:hypothetical protein
MPRGHQSRSDRNRKGSSTTRSNVRPYSTSGHGRKEAQTAIRGYRVLHFGLNAVDGDQSHVLRIQPNEDSHVPNSHRLLQVQGHSLLSANSELAEKLEINGQQVTYRASKTASNSESGTSKVAPWGASGSVLMYSGIR